MDESATVTDAAGPSESTESTATTPEVASAASAVETPPTPPAERSTEPDWDAIDKLDPDEIMRHHRRLAGKVGQLSDQRAQQLARAERARWEAETKAQQELEAARKLRDEDPYAYAQQEKEKEQRAEEDRQRETTQRDFETSIRSASKAEVDLAMWDYYQSLSPGVQKLIAGKFYPGTPRESYTAFLLEAKALQAAEHKAELEAAKQAAVDAARAEWVKTEKPRIADAARKDALSDAVATEGTPDVHEGSPSNGHINQETFDRNRHDPDWVDANYARIVEAMAAKRIRR